MQPNHSSLGQYFLGERPGQTFVDDIQNPTRAISVISWDWTYISDDADLRTSCNSECVSQTTH